MPPAVQPRPLASHEPLGFAAFVALVAALMALNALAVDIMLPALPQIGAALSVAEPNDRQAVITAYLAGFGLGQFAMGVLSDRFGRRPVLLVGLAAYAAGAALCAAAPDFTLMLAARMAQGLGAAAPRVIVTALVRDCYSGRRMAQVTSLAMMTFMAVPVLAPSIGQAILFAGSWRMIFAFLVIYAGALLALTASRLPETLPPEWRRPISLRGLRRSLAAVLGSRQTVGYALASGVFFGALFAFLASAQQILAELYGLGVWFPVVFGGIALAIAASAFANSVLVGRFGMRALSHGAATVFTLISLVLAVTASLGAPPLWAFLALLAGAMACVGLVFANYNALAMEPMGAVAGIASSFIGGVTTLIGAAPLLRDRGRLFRPGALGLLGDHRVGPARQQRVDRALVVGRVQRAVRAGGQLGDLAHHALLVLLGLGAGLVIVEHDHRGVLGVLLGPFPALHRGAHEAGHLVDEGRILEVVFQHVKPVFQRRHALILVFEGHQFVGRDAGVDDLPVFVVGHGRDAVGLPLQQRVDVEALLEHLDAVGAALGRDAELAHPAQERVLVAEEPDAQRACRGNRRAR
jgi:DHA1 family bicyclomycin/chloramphenicol resistance-like MFS transporter